MPFGSLVSGFVYTDNKLHPQNDQKRLPIFNHSVHSGFQWLFFCFFWWCHLNQLFSWFVQTHWFRQELIMWLCILMSHWIVNLTDHSAVAFQRNFASKKKCIISGVLMYEPQKSLSERADFCVVNLPEQHEHEWNLLLFHPHMKVPMDSYLNDWILLTKFCQTTVSVWPLLLHCFKLI